MAERTGGLFKEINLHPAYDVTIYDTDFGCRVTRLIERSTIPESDVVKSFVDLSIMESDTLQRKGRVLLKSRDGKVEDYSFTDDQFARPYPYMPVPSDIPTTYWNFVLRGLIAMQTRMIADFNDISVDEFIYRAVGHAVDYAERFEEGDRLVLRERTGEYIQVAPYNDPRFFPNGQIPRE